MPGANDQRANQLKQLLIKFRKAQTTVKAGSEDLEDFAKLIDLNSQLAQPKGLCIEDWALLNEAQSNDHRQMHGHTVISGETFATLDQFVAIATRYNKCELDSDGNVMSLITPTSAPPAIIQIQQQNIAEPSAMSGYGGPQMTNQNNDMPTIQSMHPPLDFSNSNIGPTMTINTVQPDAYGRDDHQEQGDPLHDPTLGNTGIEIIRLNKKFDIFMKRFMRAEEDIKEVKQNFYRVMHCAFAKYEQGFKRKNEYLERRRVKRKEEIERGVAQELKKRGMNGELDDPLLHHGIGDGDSTLGGNNRGDNDDYDGFDRNLGRLNKGFDDSELSNGIVGIDTSKKPRAQASSKQTTQNSSKKKEKDKKKKKSGKSSKNTGGRPTANNDSDDDNDIGMGDESSLKIMT